MNDKTRDMYKAAIMVQARRKLKIYNVKDI